MLGGRIRRGGAALDQTLTGETLQNTSSPPVPHAGPFTIISILDVDPFCAVTPRLDLTRMGGVRRLAFDRQVCEWCDTGGDDKGRVSDETWVTSLTTKPSADLCPIHRV